MKTQNPSQGSGFLHYFFPYVCTCLLILAACLPESLAHMPMKGTSPSSRVHAATRSNAGVPSSLTGLLPGSQATMPKLSPQKAFFMENAGQITDLQGQAVPDVRYLLRTRGLNVQLRTSGFSYDAWMPVYDTEPAQDGNTAEEAVPVAKRTVTGYKFHRVDIGFKNGNPSPQILAMDKDDLEIQIHNDSRPLSVRNYGRIIYKNIYDGIDLEFVAGGKDGTAVEYNFIVHPGADPSLIQLEYKGADDLRLEEGLIRMNITHGTIEENIPASWQEETKQAVEVNYAMCESGTVGFSVGAYDKATTLVIDPTPRLVWGTYFQSDYDQPIINDDNYTTLPNWTDEINTYESFRNLNSSVVDKDGNLYIAVSTKLPDWKVTSGAFQGEISKLADSGEINRTQCGNTICYRQNGWEQDIYIIKFNNTGRLVAATYYGGVNYEWYPSLALSNNGLFLGCVTNSPDLEAANEHPNPGSSTFIVVKFSLNLKNKLWARFMGGNAVSQNEYIAIATDPSGNVMLAAESKSTDYPNAGGMDDGSYTGNKVFGSKLNGTNGNIMWSGVLVTTDAPSTRVFYYIEGLQADKQGNFFLLVSADEDGISGPSNNFASLGTPGSYQPVYPGSAMGSAEEDKLLMKIGPTGNKLWATWVGGPGYEFYEMKSGLAIDSKGYPWISFQKGENAPLLPTTANALLPALPENYQTCETSPDELALRYLQKYSTDGDSLLYSTIVNNSSYLDEVYEGNGSFSIAIDTLTDEVYLGMIVNVESGCYPDPVASADHTTPCAHQASYGTDSRPTYGYYITKYSASADERLWSTYVGYAGSYGKKFEIEPLNNRLYYVGEVFEFNDLQDITTPGTEQPDWKNDPNNNTDNTGWLIGMLDDGELPAGVSMTPSVVTPASRTACVGGLVESFTGNKVTLTGPAGYDATVIYQWQKSNSATGPWTNMAGETAKNLTPEPRDTAGTVYFRRLAQLAGEYCDKTTYDSSIVVSLTVGPNIAPKAKAGGTKFYTCIGNSISFEGTGSGGLPPYTYAWFIGSDTMPGSTEAMLTDDPEETTLYTLKVTDANGCFGLDQVAVEPVSAYAGSDKLFCQGLPGVQLGGIPVQGASEVTYAWTPTDSLSCTTCGQPVATPTEETTYTLTVSVKEKSGEICTMTDDVTVSPVQAPNGNLNFAGPDLTLCQGETGTLGLPAVNGYAYTWAPGTYIANNRSAQTTYDAGTNVVRNPLRYALTAEKDGCVFVDYADVYTIYFQITPRNRDICAGPEWFRQEADAGEANYYAATYTWEKTSGDADIEILATAKNGADAYIRLKPGSGNSVTFRRKTTLNGKSCYSFFNTINLCQGGGGPSCYTEVRVLGASGCPLPGGGYKVYAKYTSPSDYKYKWSPSWAFDKDSVATPRLITANNGVNISVLVTNKYATNITCADTLYVNDPTLTLPIFSAQDVTGCKNDVVQIGAPPVAGYSYVWSSTTGFQGDVSVERFNSRPTLKLKSSKNYVVTVTDVGTGCFVRDTVVATVPDVFVNAGPDKQACSGAEVTIGEPAPPGTNFTYLWNPQNVPWRPVGAQGQFDPNPTLLFAGDIQMIVTATDPASGCIAKDTVMLTTPPAGVPPPLATPAPICPGEEVMIGTKPVVGAIYSWSPSTGLACATCSETLATPSSTTTYTLTVSGCGGNLTTSVTVTVLPAPPFMLTNKENCPSSPLEIGIGASGNPGSLNNVESYSWSPTSSLSCTDCPNPEATNPKPTVYKLTVKYTNGCEAEASTTITPQAGTVSDAGKDATICPGEGVPIGMSAVAGSTYSWSPSDGLDNPSMSSTTASPESTKIYTLTVTKGACTSKDSVKITVRPVPEMAFVGNTTICRGGETSLGISPAPGYRYEWSPVLGVVSPTSAITILRPTQTTTYKLTQTSTATGCSSFKKVTVTVNEPEFSIQTAVPQPLEVCQGTSVQLPMSVFPAQGNYAYSWTPGRFLDGQFDKNPLASPTFTTTYKVSVTNLANNCILTSEVPVKVIPLSQCTFRDFGDAPLGYEKNAIASHKRLGGFFIGNDIDSENASQAVFSGSVANGDDTGLFDDEDAMLPLEGLHPRKNELRITLSDVRNDTFDVAYLAAWVDLNRNGCFDDGERRVTTVPESDLGPQMAEMVWTDFNPSGILPFGNTYIRVRYTGDASGGWDENPNPTGSRSSGEVEDYHLYIYPTMPFPDFKVVAKGEKVSGSLRVNDRIPPGTTYLTPVADGVNPSNAMPMVSANGDFMFQSATPGVYHYIVPVNDGVVTVNVKFTVTVLDPLAYSPPVAGTDVGLTFQNTPVTLRTLANDFGGFVGKSVVPGSVQITVQPAHGTVSVNSTTGDITYTPNTGYKGPDTYMYSVSDNMAPTAGVTQGCQFVQVIDANSANSVLAANDQVCTGAGTKLSGNVLDNDMDPEGDALRTVPMQISTPDYTFMLDESGNYMFTSGAMYSDAVVINYIMYDDNITEERDTAMLCIYIKNILGDRVWKDTDLDGRLDPQEEGVAGAKVTLHTCTGGVPGAAVPNSTVTTDDNGNYMMPLPTPGNYALKFDLSMVGGGSGYEFTLANAGNNGVDSQDSDVDPLTGFTVCFAVSGLVSLPQFDAGVFQDSDGDLLPDEVDTSNGIARQGYIYCEQTGEILTGGKITVTGPSPATILRDGSEGYYHFLIGEAGTYQIRLTPPPGFDTVIQCFPQEDTLSVTKKYTFLLKDDFGDGWNGATMQVKQGSTVIATLGGAAFTDGDLSEVCVPLDPGTNYSLFYLNDGSYPEEVGIDVLDQNGNLVHSTGIGQGSQGTNLYTWNSGSMAVLRVLGSPNDDGATQYLDDKNCDSNPYYLTLELEPGSFFVNNNLAVSCVDFGDNPTDYSTLLDDDGARHLLYQQPFVFLGDKVDPETDGQPDAMSGIMGNGDDGNGEDDEDGISTLPTFSPGVSTPVIVKVNNTRPNWDAKLVGFADLNLDGDFDDDEEMQSKVVPAGYSGLDTLVFNVPEDAPVGEKVPVRLRISSACFDTIELTNVRTGSLDDTDSQYTRPEEEGLPCIAGSGNYYYDTLMITAPVTGTYFFNANGSDGDTWLSLYSTPFNPAQPCSNYIDSNDDGGGDRDPLISADLTAGNTYVLVFTSYGGSATGYYQIAYTVGEKFCNTLNGAAPTFNRPGGDNPDDCSVNDTPNCRYRTYTFTPSQTVTYTFNAIGSNGDTYGILYKSPFNPSATCDNFVIANDDAAGESDPYFEAELEAGVEYTYVMTTYDGGETPGSFCVTISSPMNMLLPVEPTGPIMSFDGEACNGEVEDYAIRVSGFDYGDLPDSYNTSGDNNPPRHLIQETLKLGASVDSETDGLSDDMAGLMGGGDDGNIGDVTFGTEDPNGDDEDGVMLLGMLAAGNTAAIMVDVMNMTGESAVLQGWIDFNSNGSFESDEELTTGDFSAGGAGVSVPDGGLDGEKLTFVVPQGVTFPSGMAMARFRLSPDGGLEGESQTGTVPFGEIEDYKFPLAKLGNLVWQDWDNDGFQDQGEPGLDSVKVILIWAGPDGDMDAADDNEMQMLITGPDGGFDEGEYYFCNLAAGDYKMFFEAPANFVPTAPNRGNQWQGGENDSDPVAMGMNVRMVMERTFTIGNTMELPKREGSNGDNGVNPSDGFPDNQTDETHDAGFWNPCCSDLLKYCCPSQNK